MGEYIDNAPAGGVGGKGFAADDDDIDIAGANGNIDYRDSDPLNALMDTPLLLSEDEFDVRQHSRRAAATCTVAEQGFERVDEDGSSSSAKRQLIMAITLCLIFMVAEIIGGYMAGSLAIMADAAHLLSDCISFIVSLVAIWMSRKPPDHRMTFGYKRAEVIGAIMSIFGIWLLTAFLCYFSLSRLIQNDFDIDAHTMMLISGIGIIINVIMAFILHGSCNMPHGHSHAHGHGHSHAHSHSSPPTNKHYNRLKSVSESSSGGRHPLAVAAAAADTATSNGADLPATFIINSHLHNATRNDSICSYRSPSHSRTNSFSRPNGNGNGSGGGAAPTATMLPLNNAHHAVLQMRLDDAVSAARDTKKQCTGNGRTASGRRSSDDDDCGGMASAAAAQRVNLNLRAAVIHVIGDFIQSVGVFIAAVVINYYPTAKIVDPLCTVLFSVIVMFTTVRIMRESFAIIMDAVPASVDVRRLSDELASLPGVRAVHDLCVWCVTVDWPVMAVHLVIDPGSSAEKILSSATEVAREDFGIRHCTIQLERGPELQQLLLNAMHTTHEHHSSQQQQQQQQQHHHHHHHDLIDHHGDAMIHFV